MIIRIIQIFLLLLTSIGIFAEPLPGSVRFERFGMNQGLSQNTVKSVVEDETGFIWIATFDGLNRFDGYEFKVYREDSNDPNSISDNQINVLFKDSKNRIWIGTANGLNLYDPELDRFERIRHYNNDPSSFDHNHITGIAEDRNGILWLATLDGLKMYDPLDGCFEHFAHIDGDPYSLASNRLRAVFVDSHNRLWVGTDGGGLDRFDRRTGRFVHLVRHNDKSKPAISNNRITAINEDRQGNLWVGTMYGLNRISRDLSTIDQFYHQTDEAQSLGHNVVITLGVAPNGEMLVGTIAGVSVFNHNSKGFRHWRYDPQNLNSLSDNSVWSIYVDQQQVLWIGTNLGLSRYNTHQAKFTLFESQVQNPGSLSHDNVMTILKDRKQRLWVGTNGGGLNRLDKNASGFKHFNHSPFAKNSLADDRVFSLYEDKAGVVWVGTMGGLQWFDEDRDNFQKIDFEHTDTISDFQTTTVTAIAQVDESTYFVGLYGAGLVKLSMPQGKVLAHYFYAEGQKHGLHDNWIRALLYDENGQLWIGGRTSGLAKLDVAGDTFTHYQHHYNQPQTLSNNAVFSLFKDRDGELFIGTEGGGLNRYVSASDNFVHLREKDGLANDSVYAIEQDTHGRLWLSTNQGLSRYDKSQNTFYNYTVEDGLQANEFNLGASFADDKGNLYFGGVSGFNRFNPDFVDTAPTKANIILTDLLLYNQAVEINPGADNSEGGYSLPKAVDYLDKLIFTQRENFFSVNFTALHLLKPQERRFAYRLKGWDKDWIYTTAKNRRATYTNIPAGSYTLEIKSADSNNVFGDNVKQLQIEILPPLWRTWWAYAIYIVLCAGVLLLIGYVRVEHLRAEREKTLNSQLKQVDKLKDEFLANISHELRTPLNGIIGLAESLIDGAGGQLPGKARNDLTMVVSSGKRLANLVNDILDFSKLNNDSIELNRRSVDLRAISEVVLTLCKPLVGNKELQLINNIPHKLPAADADEERIGQVIHNLVSNAVKFTDKGKITLEAFEHDGMLVLNVTDTGIGITQSHLESIFVSFKQADNGLNRQYGGSGLGLAVSRQLVELHGGQLQVSSQAGIGSTFSLSLPKCERKQPSETPAESKQTSEETAQTIAPVLHKDTSLPARKARSLKSNKGFRILLVDDEPINRQVLLNHLSVENYQLVEASGGQRALDIIKEQQDTEPFDLILLDIMMPRVSGFEVCRQVREKHSINDLPIIFLTARSQASDMMESFAVGANDYLSKPVSKPVLLSRVATHLKLLDINRNLEAKVEQRTEDLKQSNLRNNAINQICTQISTTLDLEQLRDTAYNHLKELMDVYTFCIGIYHKDEQKIEFNHVIEGDEYLEPFNVYMEETNRPAVWCVKNRQPLVINDYLRDHGKYFGDDAVPLKPMKGIKVQSLVYWPLIVSDHLIGVISVQSHEKGAYHEQHLDMISTIASTAAIAVDNANAYWEIEQKNKALVDTQQQLIQQEKMASLGTLTAGVAHEINNPTNFVHVSAQNLEVDLRRAQQFFVDLAGDDADDMILDSFAQQFRPLRDHLTTIQDGTERIKSIVKDLRLFTQLDTEEKREVDVVECLESTLHLVKTKYLEVAEFKTDYQGTPVIQGYPSQLNQVFMNLLVNACDAIRDREGEDNPPGLINISCRATDKQIEVRIKDNGCGMTEQTKQKLFEPFFTTKTVGHGTGLGLSISYGIVQKHGGELTVSTELDDGCEFLLTLPL